MGCPIAGWENALCEELIVILDAPLHDGAIVTFQCGIASVYVCVANGEKCIVIWDIPLQDRTAHMFVCPT